MISEPRIKKVAFSLGFPGDLQGKLESLIVFDVGRYKVIPNEKKSTNQLIDGEHVDYLRWLELSFEFTVNYKGGQANNGITATVGGFTFASKTNTDFVAIANRMLNQQDLYFFPILQNGNDTVDLDTFYLVSSDMSATALIDATKAGFFDPAVPLKMKLKQPLTAYPSWLTFQQ